MPRLELLEMTMSVIAEWLNEGEARHSNVINALNIVPGDWMFMYEYDAEFVVFLLRKGGSELQIYHHDQDFSNLFSHQLPFQIGPKIAGEIFMCMKEDDIKRIPIMVSMGWQHTPMPSWKD